MNKYLYIILAIFLGGFGMQRLYVGRIASCILCLLFCWTWIPAFLGLIDAIRVVFLTQEQFNEMYK